MHSDSHALDIVLAAVGGGLWAWDHFVDAASSPKTIGFLTAVLLALRIAYLIHRWARKE